VRRSFAGMGDDFGDMIFREIDLHGPRDRNSY
jgi:hypothetical protein